MRSNQKENEAAFEHIAAHIVESAYPGLKLIPSEFMWEVVKDDSPATNSLGCVMRIEQGKLTILGYAGEIGDATAPRLDRQYDLHDPVSIERATSDLRSYLTRVIDEKDNE